MARSAAKSRRQPTTPDDDRREARREQLEADLDEAQARERELLARHDLSAQHQRDVAVASVRAWRIRALLHHDDEDWDASRKASSTADELAKLAAKLERASLTDRVAQLEELVRAQGLAGARLQALSRSRRRGPAAGGGE